MPPKKDSAGARIKKTGRKLVWVTADTGQQAKIRMAAAYLNKPMSQFLLDAGLAEAEKILKKIHFSS